ncbi:MAG: SMP-30/gluconolactonase/LRE family protein [Terracidiphilus sp.]
MQSKLAQFFLSALFIAGAQLITAQNQALGRPVAIDRLAPGSLFVLGAQGAVHAVDFQGGRPAITGTFRLPSGWAGSDIVCAQVGGQITLFIATNYGLTGQVSMYSATGTQTRSWTLRSGVAGIQYDAADSTLYVASGRTPEIFRITMANGSQPEFVAEASGSQRLGPIVYDSKEKALLVGDLVMGAIYRVDIANHKSSLLFSGLTSPQALKLSPDGSTLLIADAGARRVMSYSVAQPKAAPRVFAKLPEFRSPSGLAWANEGLVVSDDGAKKLFFLSKSGILQETLPAEK